MAGTRLQRRIPTDRTELLVLLLELGDARRCRCAMGCQGMTLTRRHPTGPDEEPILQSYDPGDAARCIRTCKDLSTEMVQVKTNLENWS